MFIYLDWISICRSNSWTAWRADRWCQLIVMSQISMVCFEIQNGCLILAENRGSWIRWHLEWRLSSTVVARLDLVDYHDQPRLHTVCGLDLGWCNTGKLRELDIECHGSIQLSEFVVLGDECLSVLRVTVWSERSDDSEHVLPNFLDR